MHFLSSGKKIKVLLRRTVASKAPTDCSDHPTDGFARLRASHGRANSPLDCYISLFESAVNTKSPTPNGDGLFVAVLNLMYISAKILKRLKVKILRVATVFLCSIV